MWKTEINKNDIERTISKGLGEEVRIVESKSDDDYHKQKLSIYKKDKTGKFTIEIYQYNIVQGDIYKKIILDLIQNNFIKTC